MNRPILIIIFSVLCHLLTFSQATSLTVDCQTPGWLSSKIPYPDQQSVRNLKVTGFINKDDLVFIGTLIMKQSLDGCLDLSETEITPYNKLDRDAFNITQYDSIGKIILPKSLISSDKCFVSNTMGTYNDYKLLQIDTLVAGGYIMHNIKQNSFTSNILNLIFREGTDSIDTSAFNKSRLISVYFPEGLKHIATRSFIDSPNLSNINLPNSIEQIEDKAFFGTSYKPDTLLLPNSLTTYYMTAFPLQYRQVIYIPEKVTKIYNYTVSYNNSSNTHSYSIYMNRYTDSEIHTKALTPPQVIDYDGGEYSYSCGKSFIGYTIYVPKGTKELYESTSPWSNATIIEETVIPQNIEIEEDSIILIPNESKQLFASVIPENADTDVTWTSSDNRVATVDASGVVLAKNKGRAIIYATTTDGSNLMDSCIVSVVQPVDGVTMEKHSLTLNAGDSEQLYANVLPVNADNKKLIWSTSDSEIAEVDADGNVTAKKCGVAFIKATSVDNPLAADSCKVTVLQPVTGISLNYNTVELHKIGETVQLVATVLPEDASNKEVRWMSSNQSVCMVANGTVVAVGYGTSVIIATTVDGSYMATCTVNVVEGADLPGDVNHDGEVNIADINSIIDIILGGNPNDEMLGCADVNGDGEVNIADINAVIDIILSH